jgi:hypothetical protein
MEISVMKRSCQSSLTWVQDTNFGLILTRVLLLFVDDILTIMEEIKEPEKIKQYLDLARNDKSL